MSLKQKTLSGLLWSFVDTMAGQGITFVVGIILARLLTPREFGLIGMITVFIAVSESFINSGFSSALIRKKDCTDTDFSTVFFFNLAAGILFFLLLFFSAPAISGFFNEPELTAILQVLGIVLIIDSLTLIQRTILTKRIDFIYRIRCCCHCDGILWFWGMGLSSTENCQTRTQLPFSLVVEPLETVAGFQQGVI